MYNEFVREIGTTKEQLIRWWGDNDGDEIQDGDIDKICMGSIKNDKEELPIYCYYNQIGRLITVYENSYETLKKIRVR